MSTAQVYLNDEEIEELVRDIPLDTSIIYGEEKKSSEFALILHFILIKKNKCARIFDKSN
jgi:hypothetical protein